MEGGHMKVRQLSDALAITHGEGKVNQLLTVISHWTKKLFDSPETEYITSNEKDMKSLYFLRELKIIELAENAGQATAKLTKEGKDLYWDFLGKGYYGSSKGFG